MLRISLLFLFIAIAHTGCNKRAPQPEASDAEQRKAMEDYARSKLPVLDRTIVKQELQQLLQGLQATSGWPNNIAAAHNELKQDMNFGKLFQRVNDGTYVILDKATANGTVIYCTKETTVGYIAVTTSGEFLELKKSDVDALAQQR
jgi:hypothetical protein